MRTISVAIRTSVSAARERQHPSVITIIRGRLNNVKDNILNHVSILQANRLVSNAIHVIPSTMRIHEKRIDNINVPPVYRKLCISYLTENHGCSLKVCYCANGAGATGDYCTTHGNNQCSDCNSGYTLGSDKWCRQNQCTCQHGTGAVGDACPTNGGDVCASCTSGYTPGLPRFLNFWDILRSL